MPLQRFELQFLSLLFLRWESYTCLVWSRWSDLVVYVGLTIWLSTSNGWRVLAGPDFVDCFGLRPCLRLCSLDQDCQSGFSLWRLRGIFGSLVRGFSAPVDLLDGAGSELVQHWCASGRFLTWENWWVLGSWKLGAPGCDEDFGEGTQQVVKIVESLRSA